MRLALREAARALEHDDVPIGAVVVQEGEVIGAAHNEREVRSARIAACSRCSKVGWSRSASG